ncbi:Two-component system response regulator [Christiangramia flava JLT2011]|uniref:Two-component system response regulator n=1 Tax=Christiangramia flava JLT2011 TaxID=1229726 RepID=A0A1L7I2I5_9FLAO|nr:Two-component system response regulator [Christiangramia flava JLT2011]OSS40313.1 Two-component system response regulator [Christiangramia flava JLT2011]
MIVDDEEMALNLLESYVQKTPFLELKGKCHNAIEALQQVKSQESIDLILLDIQMPDLNGIEFSKTLDKNTRVIFTTAFDKYALDGFKVDALDFLLKPFNYSEFLTAVNKAYEWFDLKRGKHPYSASPGHSETKKFLFVKSEYRQLKIDLADVLYFEGLKDYIKIKLGSSTKPVLTLQSLKALENILSPEKFMRIHRSYIISLDKIEEIERSHVIIDGKRIKVSEQYKADFQNYLSKNSILPDS